MTDSTGITLALVGDLVPTRQIFDGDHPACEETAEVATILAGADLAVGCLLPPLTEQGRPAAKLIAIRTPAERCEDLRKLGLGAIHLANNHIMDYGDQGLADTMATLAGHGMYAFGAGTDLAAAERVHVVEKNGLRVGLLAWSTCLPTGAQAGEGRAGIAPIPVRVAYEVDPLYLTEEPTYPPQVRSWIGEADLDRVISRVRDVRAGLDALVVAVHWGEGVGDRTAEYQLSLGRALIDAGADVVYGTHPHRVQGVELRSGKPILYSPGLFLDQAPREGISPEEAAVYAGMSPDSYIALVTFGEAGWPALRLVPTTRGTNGDPSLAQGADFSRITDRLRSTSAPRHTDVVVTEGRYIEFTAAAR